MNVDFRAMLQQGEKFEQPAGIGLTMPSASASVLGTGQTVMRLAWGFSTPITSGEVGYEKAAATQRSELGVNVLQPELISRLPVTSTPSATNGDRSSARQR